MTIIRLGAVVIISKHSVYHKHTPKVNSPPIKCSNFHLGPANDCCSTIEIHLIISDMIICNKLYFDSSKTCAINFFTVLRDISIGHHSGSSVSLSAIHQIAIPLLIHFSCILLFAFLSRRKFSMCSLYCKLFLHMHQRHREKQILACAAI